MDLEDKFQYFTRTQTFILFGMVLIVVGLFSWNFFIQYNSIQEQSIILENLLNATENILGTMEETIKWK